MREPTPTQTGARGPRAQCHGRVRAVHPSTLNERLALLRAAVLVLDRLERRRWAPRRVLLEGSFIAALSIIERAVHDSARMLARSKVAAVLDQPSRQVPPGWCVAAPTGAELQTLAHLSSPDPEAESLSARELLRALRASELYAGVACAEALVGRLGSRLASLEPHEADSHGYDGMAAWLQGLAVMGRGAGLVISHLAPQAATPRELRTRLGRGHGACGHGHRPPADPRPRRRGRRCADAPPEHSAAYHAPGGRGSRPRRRAPLPPEYIGPVLCGAALIVRGAQRVRPTTESADEARARTALA